MNEMVLREAIADLKLFVAACKQEKKHWDAVVKESQGLHGTDYEIDGTLSLLVEKSNFAIFRKQTKEIKKRSSRMIDELSELLEDLEKAA